ncbi:MAG: tryptophan-rich sensory protein [Candidatus Promineifilaceae bacterium]|jgi:translocator protein
MNNDRVRQILVIVAVLATIAVNIMANALPINGQNTGEISDRFDVYFVPAGYVFSIWGLIYLGLLAYAVYQALPAQAENPSLRSIGYLFVLSCLANIAWIFLWHYNQVTLSVLAMLALLGLLITIYLRLDIGRAQVSSATKWFVHVPFSIYLGWITVATIANITSWLYSVEWSGWGISPEMWTVIMLTIATIVGGAMSFTRGDIAYAAVLIWSFIGIALKHQDTAVVSYAAWIAAIVTAILIIIGAYRKRQSGSDPALAT